MPDAIAISASATRSPPSDTSCTAVATPRRSARARNRRSCARPRDRPAAARPPRARRSRADRATGRASPWSRRSAGSPRPAALKASVADSGEVVDAGRRRRWWASAGSRGRWSRCRATRCRTRPGSRAPCRPSAMPRMQPTSWPMISGRSGLPKLRLSVSASGRAPTAVRLRQASATACLPPSNGSASQ